MVCCGLFADIVWHEARPVFSRPLPGFVHCAAWPARTAGKHAALSWLTSTAEHMWMLGAVHSGLASTVHTLGGMESHW